MLYLVPSSAWFGKWRLYDGECREHLNFEEEKIARNKLSVSLLNRRFVVHDGRGWFSSIPSEIYENAAAIGTLITTYSDKLILKTKFAEYIITAKPVSIWSLISEFCVVVTRDGVPLGEILRMYETIKDMNEIDYSKLAHSTDKELLVYAAYWFGCEYACQSSD